MKHKKIFLHVTQCLIYHFIFSLPEQEYNHGQFLWTRILGICSFCCVFYCWGFYFLISIFYSTTSSSFFSLQVFHPSFYYCSFCPFLLLLQHFTVWSCCFGALSQSKFAYPRIHSIFDWNLCLTMSFIITDKTHEF